MHIILTGRDLCVDISMLPLRSVVEPRAFLVDHVGGDEGEAAEVLKSRAPSAISVDHVGGEEGEAEEILEVARFFSDLHRCRCARQPRASTQNRRKGRFWIVRRDRNLLCRV